MWVFVDESGDTGLKLGKGSSDWFVLTLVIFSDAKDVNSAEQSLSSLRQTLGLKADYEFHFSHSKTSVKDAFFNQISGERFSFCSVAIEKAKLAQGDLANKKAFLKRAFELVFDETKSFLQNAKIAIDGSGSREFRRETQSLLKKYMNEDSGTKRIKKVVIEDSKKNDLIQLADMVCGAIAREIKGKPDGKRYLGVLNRQNGTIKKWP